MSKKLFDYIPQQDPEDTLRNITSSRPLTEDEAARLLTVKKLTNNDREVSTMSPPLVYEQEPEPMETTVSPPKRRKPQRHGPVSPLLVQLLMAGGIIKQPKRKELK